MNSLFAMAVLAEAGEAAALMLGLGTLFTAGVLLFFAWFRESCRFALAIGAPRHATRQTHVRTRHPGQTRSLLAPDAYSSPLYVT
jgi:hypothetical protein